MTYPLTPHFDRFFQQLEAINRTLHFSIAGIARETGTPRAIAALTKWEIARGKSLPPDKQAQRIEDAESRATFAKAQIDDGFSLLYSNATVAIWAALEALIENIVATSLQFQSKHVNWEVVRKIKLSFSEYEQLEPEERYSFVVSELARQNSASLKRGVSRFESLLEAVNLSGPISDTLIKTFLEFWAVRNVIVHRAGVADRRLVDSCPWLQLRMGQEVKITADAYLSYFNAAHTLLKELLIRDLVRDGRSRESAEDYFSSGPQN